MGCPFHFNLEGHPIIRLYWVAMVTHVILFLFKYRYSGGTAVQNLLGVSRLVLLEGEIACASISEIRILYH